VGSGVQAQSWLILSGDNKTQRKSPRDRGLLIFTVRILVSAAASRLNARKRALACTETRISAAGVALQASVSPQG
jgi:hypothetical protein